MVNESDPLQLSFGLTLMQIIDVVKTIRHFNLLILSYLLIWFDETMFNPRGYIKLRRRTEPVTVLCFHDFDWPDNCGASYKKYLADPPSGLTNSILFK